MKQIISFNDSYFWMRIAVIQTIQTGCECLDNYLGGGISPGNITLIYGEPETGKTTLAMQCAMNCALKNHENFVHRL